MLDIRFIRENPDKVKESISRRGIELDVDKILELDKRKRELLSETEKLRAKRNEISNIETEPSAGIIQQGREMKNKLNILESKLRSMESKLNDLLSCVPNLLHPAVPDGKDENDNVEIRKWGEPTRFEFKPKDHFQIGKDLDIIDTKTSARVSGTRFSYLKNEAVSIQFALIQFTLKTLTNQKIIRNIAKKASNPSDNIFIPVIPPVMMKSGIMKKMARLEPIEERYCFPKDDLVLVGSAEHTLGPMHMREILELSRLPIRYVGYSTSFRREAGSYGKDTKGILRVHQFDKLEMETFSIPEHSEVEQEFLVGIQEYLMQQLKIPYRVIMICAGDMGNPDYRQIDIEAWLPGQNKYRETHTSDFMTDYQARRLNIRYRSKDGQLKYVHMNDATAFAIGRTLIAILENYQQKDGSIKMPKVLHKYLGFEKISKK